MYLLKKTLLIVCCLFGFISCSQKKINGASIVSPPDPIDKNCYISLQKTNANWVAIIPYAFTPHNSSEVRFDDGFQWWGETSEGTTALIEQAQKNKLKVLLKPHIWHQQTWIGDFELHNETDWLQWEKAYTKYILNYAKIAQNKKVDLFCVGTELKKAVQHRPLFFKSLIPKIKHIYKGKLTYAANWDNVKHIPFWEYLDYIGVDAYYTLSENKTPTVDELINAWKPIKKELASQSLLSKKPVLFTEYGFESCDYNTKETWGNYGKHPANEIAQVNAYQAFFESFYQENWFAGGFLWKWHISPKTIRNKPKAFTPQGKKALNIIQQNFKNY